MKQILIYDDSESNVQDYKEEKHNDDLKLPEFTDEEIELNRRVEIKPPDEILYLSGIAEVDGQQVIIISVATPIKVRSQDEIRRIKSRQPKAEAYLIYHKFDEGGGLAEAPIDNSYYDPPVQGTDPEVLRLRHLSEEDLRFYERNIKSKVTKRYERRLLGAERRALKPAKRDVTLSKDESEEIMHRECKACRHYEKCWDSKYDYSVFYNDRHLCFKRCKIASQTGPSGLIFDTQVWLYVPRMQNATKRENQKTEIMDVLGESDGGLTQAEVVRRVTETPAGTVPKRLKELQEEGFVDRDHLTKKFYATA